jgi:hypothetical protein
MLRRKLGSVVQVGARIREELRRKIEASAKAHHLSFNQELAARLEESFQREPIEGLLARLDTNMAIVERDTRQLRVESREVMRAFHQLVLTEGRPNEVQAWAKTWKSWLQEVSADGVPGTPPAIAASGESADPPQAA